MSDDIKWLIEPTTLNEMRIAIDIGEKVKLTQEVANAIENVLNEMKKFPVAGVTDRKCQRACLTFGDDCNQTYCKICMPL